MKVCTVLFIEHQVLTVIFVVPISLLLLCMFSSHLFLSNLVHQFLSRHEPFVAFGRNDLPVSNLFLALSVETIEPATIQVLSSRPILADY